MTHEEAYLLDAVCAAPGNDLPRLIYADWLDRYGGPDGALRAEFIRLQIQVALGHGSLEHHRQQSEILDAEVAGGMVASFAWAGLTSRFFLVRGLAEGWTFRRGFVNHVRGPLDKLLDHGAAIRIDQPVSAFFVTDREPEYNDSDGLMWTHASEAEYPAWSLISSSVLPRRVWLKLSKGMGYGSRDEALQDLNGSVFRICRGRAGHDSPKGG